MGGWCAFLLEKVLEIGLQLRDKTLDGIFAVLLGCDFLNLHDVVGVCGPAAEGCYIRPLPNTNLELIAGDRIPSMTSVTLSCYPPRDESKAANRTSYSVRVFASFPSPRSTSPFHTLLCDS